MRYSYSVDYWGVAGQPLVDQLTRTRGTTARQRKSAAAQLWRMARAGDGRLGKGKLLAVHLTTVAGNGAQMLEFVSEEAK